MKSLAIFGVVAFAWCATPAFADDNAVSDPFAKSAEHALNDSSHVTRLKPNAPPVATRGSKSYLKIETELYCNTMVEFTNVPLADALQDIAKAHEISIAIDERSLSAKQIDSQSPVSLLLKNVPLHGVLTIMLAGKNLDYVCKDDVLQVKTKEDVNKESVVVRYPTKSLGKQGDDLAGLVQTSLNNKHSKPMPISVVKLVRDSDPEANETELVVNANRTMHLEVQKILLSLKNPAKK